MDRYQGTLADPDPSFPHRREPSAFTNGWMPAYAGMTLFKGNQGFRFYNRATF